MDKKIYLGVGAVGSVFNFIDVTARCYRKTRMKVLASVIVHLRLFYLHPLSEICKGVVHGI